MKKMFAFVVVAMLLLAIPAAAANYKLNGTFSGGYKYSNGTATDSLSLTLSFQFDEAGLLTAYAPFTFLTSPGIGAGWWVKYATEPLNVIISDNSTDGYKWSKMESNFTLLSSVMKVDHDQDEATVIPPATPTARVTPNRYSKVWGQITPNLKYAAQAAVEQTTVADSYEISAQLAATLPLGLTLTTDWGWLFNDGVYGMGLTTALTGAVPVIGGKFTVAVGNFADLESYPGLYFWSNDDLYAFAAYAGVKEIKLNPLTIDEVSYKMGMGNVYTPLLSSTSFYAMGLQEVTTNATLKLAPVTVTFKNSVWFESFNADGGNNANLDVEVELGDLTLGLNLDSKLNWNGGFWHGEQAELRADYVGAIGELGGHVGYNSNWDGVGQYEVDEAANGADMVYGGLYYNAPFGLDTEAWASYDQKLTNTAIAGLFTKYENKYTTIPFIVDLNALVAGFFEFTWTEAPSYQYEPIGFVKLDATIDGQWSAGMFFLTKEDGSAVLAFDPVVSVYAKYLATDKVTVTGRVTYRGFDLFTPAPPSVTPGHKVYAKLQGEIKISDNAKATVFWGMDGFDAITNKNHAQYGKPWAPYYASVGDMYWDTFGANFTIKF